MAEVLHRPEHKLKGQCHEQDRQGHVQTSEQRGVRKDVREPLRKNGYSVGDLAEEGIEVHSKAAIHGETEQAELRWHRNPRSLEDVDVRLPLQ